MVLAGVILLLNTWQALELSLKSLKKSCFGREFCPTPDNFNCLKSVLSSVGAHNVGEMNGEAFDFGQKMAI